MSHWIIETKHNWFEGNSIAQAMREAINHYCLWKSKPEEVNKIYELTSGEITQQVEEFQAKIIERKINIKCLN